MRAVQRGIHLVEALVSLVVVAAGVLATLASFASAHRTSLAVHESALITHSAHEFAERMRANRAGVQAGAYDYLHHGTTATACTTGCTPAATALTDYVNWRESLRGSIAEGVAVVCRDSTPDDGLPESAQCDGTGNRFAVKIWWDGDRSGTLKRFVLPVVP